MPQIYSLFLVHLLLRGHERLIVYNLLQHALRMINLKNINKKATANFEACEPASTTNFISNYVHMFINKECVSLYILACISSYGFTLCSSTQQTMVIRNTEERSRECFS